MRKNAMYTIKNKKKGTKNKTLKKKHYRMSRLNDSFVKVLLTLKNNMMRNGELMRARAYNKAMEAIIKYPGDIISLDQLESVRNIGPSTIKHLKNYMETKSIEVIESPVRILTDVYGIGPKKARTLIDEEKITTIEELEERKMDVLNDVQRKGLRYYEDFRKRIPREEINAYLKILTRYFNQLSYKEARFEIVGSWRRGALDSGDIDVIITDESNGVFHDFINLLIKKKIVIETLSRGNTKCLAVSRLANSPARRIDFLYTPPREWPFALLYFTGNAEFNVVMRETANTQGYSLNEHGLYKNKEKVERKFETEESIFDYLGLVYKEPKERIGGQAVIKGKKKKIIKKRVNMRQLLEKLQNRGISTLKNLSEEKLTNMIRHANKLYYNEKPILTDETYDILKEYVEKKYPNNDAVHEIGAPVEKNKATLPYFMGSMDKIKPDTNIVPQWKEKYPGSYVISGKLNGVSGLYTTEDEEPKLYTRGNGSIGEDVSHLIPYLNLPETSGLVIRGEFIITKEVFEDRYSEKAANPLGAIVSTVNAMQLNKQKLEDLQFVAYEVIKPTMKPSDQMKFLEKNEFSTVIYEIKDDITNEMLSANLTNWRENYDFQIDGVIIVSNKIYPREKCNPSYAFAFKMVLSDQVVEAKVLDVVWEASMYGYLKPRIRLEPVMIGGAKIEFVTGFNGGYINENKIGVGTILKLVRSGDVIPHILEVVKPSLEAKMPFESYRWTSTKVDLILLDIHKHPDVCQKQIIYFFKKLNVVGIGPGNVKKLVEAGYDTIPSILEMSKEDLLKIDGFQKTKVDKIFKSIVKRLKEVSLPNLMAASCVFGRGMASTRIEQILNEYPDILVTDDSYDELVDKIFDIKGFALKTARSFARYVPKFLKFMRETGLKKSLIWETKERSTHELVDKKIIMTGFRDDVFQEMVEKATGLKMSKSLSKKTFALVVLDMLMENVKTVKAKKMNIPIYTKNDFVEKYFK